MKSYIDVNFTVEEDLSNWNEESKDNIIREKKKIIDFFKEDLLNSLDYSQYIKDLNVTITFEERK